MLETLSRLALIGEGLPEPELQVDFHDGSGLIGRVDMWWPGLGVIGEADGLVKYGTGADVVREKVREDRLRATGRMVVRWTWSEITCRTRHGCATGFGSRPGSPPRPERGRLGGFGRMRGDFCRFSPDAG